LVSNIPSLEALCIGSAFAFLFLLIVNIKNGTIKELGKYRVKDYAIMAGLGFIGLFLYSGLYYYGLTQLSSQEACIVNYLWPMMLVLFSTIILKEKLTVVKSVAMISSFIGVVILSVGSGSSGNGNVMLGIGSCVIAAACYGLFSVLNKKADYDQNITMMIIWLVVAICSAVFGLMTESWVPIAGLQWAGIIWMGVFTDAVAYLLWALALKGVENRKARFRTVIALNINGEQHFFEGKVEGIITKEQHGEKGFGYDPIFLPDGFDQTFAEMSMEVKNEISHRGRATKKLIEFLMHNS
jgi:drug/metabolite transporter (DMT)-like permease